MLPLSAPAPRAPLAWSARSTRYSPRSSPVPSTRPSSPSRRSTIVWRPELESEGMDMILIDPSTISTPIWSKAIARPGRAASGQALRGWRRYRERLTAFRESLRSADEHGKSPEDVAEVIAQALTDREARRTRTSSAPRARLATALRPLVPDRRSRQARRADRQSPDGRRASPRPPDPTRPHRAGSGSRPARRSRLRARRSRARSSNATSASARSVASRAWRSRRRRRRSLSEQPRGLGQGAGHQLAPPPGRAARRRPAAT